MAQEDKRKRKASKERQKSRQESQITKKRRLTSETSAESMATPRRTGQEKTRVEHSLQQQQKLVPAEAPTPMAEVASRSPCESPTVSMNSNPTIVVQQAQQQLEESLQTSWADLFADVMLHSGTRKEEIREIWGEDIDEMKQAIMKMVDALKTMAETLREMVFSVYDEKHRSKSDWNVAVEHLRIAQGIDIKKKEELTRRLLEQCDKLWQRINGIECGEESQVMVNEQRQRRAVEPEYKKEEWKDEGIYVLNIKAHSAQTNPVNIFYKAIKTTPLQVLKVTEKGLEADVTCRTRRDMEKAKMAVTLHNEKNKKERNKQLHVEERITARKAIKTATFSMVTKNRLPFVDKGRVDVKEARRTLHMRNSLWFRAETDVIAVEVHKTKATDEDRYLMKIMCSTPAHGRIMRDVRKGCHIDLEEVRLEVFDASSSKNCFKCHGLGHKSRDCTMKGIQCKYCPGHHKTDECPVKQDKNSHQCYRCKNFNRKVTKQSDKRNDNHMATHEACPTAQEELAKIAQSVKDHKRKR